METNSPATTELENYSGGSAAATRGTGPGTPPIAAGWSFTGGAITPNSAGPSTTDYEQALREKVVHRSPMGT